MKIKNEAELLSMFCDEKELRPLLRAPLFNTKYNEVWSTDGCILIRIKPERLNGKYPKGELKLPNQECSCKKKVTIEAIEEVLKKCPQVDEEIVVQEAIECDECNGEGEVYWEYRDSKLCTHEQLHSCPICRGSGKMKPEIRRKTGNKIAYTAAIVKVGNAYMYARYINILRIAMKHLNAFSVEMVFNPKMGMSEFAIGDIRIGIGHIIYNETVNECNARLKLIDL
jgi:hypothetical protein